MTDKSDREKSDKVNISNQVKHVPKDAQVVVAILKDMGISEYEPRVINQLLEFTYRMYIFYTQTNFNHYKLWLSTNIT